MSVGNFSSELGPHVNASMSYADYITTFVYMYTVQSKDEILQL